MPGTTAAGSPYALPEDPLVQWPATSQSVAARIDALDTRMSAGMVGGLEGTTPVYNLGTEPGLVGFTVSRNAWGGVGDLDTAGVLRIGRTGRWLVSVTAQVIAVGGGDAINVSGTDVITLTQGQYLQGIARKISASRVEFGCAASSAWASPYYFADPTPAFTAAESITLHISALFLFAT